MREIFSKVFELFLRSWFIGREIKNAWYSQYRTDAIVEMQKKAHSILDSGVQMNILSLAYVARVKNILPSKKYTDLNECHKELKVFFELDKQMSNRSTRELSGKYPPDTPRDRIDALESLLQLDDDKGVFTSAYRGRVRGNIENYADHTDYIAGVLHFLVWASNFTGS